MTSKRLISTALAFLFIININLFAEILSDPDFSYSLDLPEGYKLENAASDGKSYSFTHPDIPVSFIIKVYEGKQYADSEETLKQSIEKLQKNAPVEVFKWNDSESAISELNFTLDKNYAGWAICAPLQKSDSYIVLLSYSPEDQLNRCSQFIISGLNSLCVNEDFYNTPGPVMSFGFPEEGSETKNLKIYGKKVQFKMDKSDKEASQFLVDLEYGVLSLYVQHNLWKEAWERYYRMIYRDSFSRIENGIETILTTLEPYAEKYNPSNPTLGLAQMILTWVQTSEYKNHTGDAQDSDFTSLPRAICGEANDCDSRALLVCMFMRSMGLESFILISPEYSHAMAAVDIDAPGQKYKPEGSDKEYLMGETTAEVTWGMIAENQADRSKWFPVYLP